MCQLIYPYLLPQSRHCPECKVCRDKSIKITRKDLDCVSKCASVFQVEKVEVKGEKSKEKIISTWADGTAKK